MAACKQRYYNDIMEIGVDKFTRAYYPKNRYGMMSTQIAESMNSVLLDLRKLPIATLVEQIRDLMQNWFHNRHTIANHLRSDLTPAANNHILKGVKPSYKCIIRLISYQRYSITENQNNSIVDIQAKTCGCRGWDLEKLPRKHALACARYASIPVPEMCSDYYRSDCLREAYQGEINPFTHESNWVVPDEVWNILVRLWKVRSLPGRPKKSRPSTDLTSEASAADDTDTDTDTDS
ncbi:hypothetical protein QYF36_008202 [Acer negundo]|nr:hypothetical protein QYF36_008202 [Acer negundo]